MTSKSKYRCSVTKDAAISAHDLSWELNDKYSQGYELDQMVFNVKRGTFVCVFKLKEKDNE